MAASYTCSICGKSHGGLPTDYAYKLPDDVWAMPEQEREVHAKWSSDLCRLGNRFFIRCILFVPFTERAGEFGWGVWAEVSEPVFQRYLQVYEHDATGEPEATGLLANTAPAYPQVVGAPVLIKFGSSTERPSVRFPPSASHPFAHEQRNGINEARYHEVLVSTGAISGP